MHWAKSMQISRFSTYHSNRFPRVIDVIACGSATAPKEVSSNDSDSSQRMYYLDMFVPNNKLATQITTFLSLKVKEADNELAF